MAGALRNMVMVLEHDVGQIVDGRYRIADRLGVGGMGATYRAIDEQTGRTIVVKIPSLALIGDPGTFSRYQRELEIGQRLEHPGVQRLLTSGQLPGGAPYMILEFVPGETMRTYLSEHAPLPIDEAIRHAADLADTLRYCHERGVIHRDLKPENLYLTPDGRVVVGDFGIALLQGARRLTFRRLTNTVGTPDYMAPEQVSGERGDARTDVYAVGVLLYEMLTGKVPFRGDNALAVMGQRLTTDPPSVRALRREVSPELDATVRRALARDREARYPSMAALRADLLHPEGVVTASAPAMSAPLAPRGDLPRPATAALIIGAVFAALLAIGVLAQLAHQAQR
ncbi:MAG: serine/threonine-protein kinase [Candidatus Limnocylindria bacterium]